MTDTQLQHKAASVIRSVVGEFRWEQPGLREYGHGSVMVLIHDVGDRLRAYCNYDCYEYQKIEQLSDALAEVGLYVEDCTGDYSAVYKN